MGERILNLSKEETLNEVVENINTIINQKNTPPEESYNQEKINSLQEILTLSADIQNRILKIIRFIDDLFISKEEKVDYIITVASLIKFGKLNISELEDGRIFVLADYFKDKKVEAIPAQLIVINQPFIINSIRNKVLENDMRIKLIEYACKLCKEKKVNASTLEKFAKEFGEMINKLDYYELLKLVEK